MNSNARRKIWASAGVLGFIGAVWLAATHDHRSYDGGMFQRHRGADWLRASLLRCQQQSGGEIPDSIAAIMAGDPDTWNEERNLSMAPAIEEDKRAFNTLARSVLLRDFSGASGTHHSWAIAVLIPNEGRFSRIQKDYIYVICDCSNGEVLSLEQAKEQFGEVLLNAATTRDKEMRQHK